MKKLSKFILIFLLLTINYSFASNHPNSAHITGNIPSLCNQNASTCTVDMLVYGKVQHVHFREDVLTLAIQHQLTGMDKNLKNGSVYVILQGKPQDVIDTINLLANNHFSNPHAHVKLLKIKPLDTQPLMSNFTIQGWTSSRYCVKKPTTIVWQPTEAKYYNKAEADKIVFQLFSPWIHCLPKYK